MKYPPLALALARAALLSAAALTVPLASRAGPPRAADAAAALPVTSSFEKVTVDGTSAYVLKLKNTAAAAVKLTVTIAPSVTFHGSAKSSTLPDHVVAAGDTWSIEDLHAQDKVSVAAAGFATLDLTVP